MILSLLVWIVTSNPHVTHQEALRITRVATHIIKREVGVTIRHRFRDITRKELDALRYTDISCTGLEIYCNKLRNKKGLTAILTEPMGDKFGNRYFYGFANDVCVPKGGTCQVGVERERTNGETDGIRRSAAVLAHELLHLLGSDQDYHHDCSLGDTLLLGCMTEAPIHASRQSKKQVKRCIRRFGR